MDANQIAERIREAADARVGLLVDDVWELAQEATNGQDNRAQIDAIAQLLREAADRLVAEYEDEAAAEVGTWEGRSTEFGA